MIAARKSISQRSRPTPQTGATPPDAASLREAALAHLARYATTRASLTAVLDRRIRRWSARAAALGDPDAVAATADALRETVRALVRTLAEGGLVNDRIFAEGRARRLAGAGRSRSAILMHLAARGVERTLAEESAPADEETELLAALAYARRRRCGPFRVAPAGSASETPAAARDLAAFGRAGFRHDIARRVLNMTAEDAKQQLEAAKADWSR